MSVTCVTHVVVLTILFVAINAFNQYNRGWTPIPNAEIYRRFRINTNNPNNIQHIDSPWTSHIDITTEMNGVNRNDAIKIIEPNVFGSFKVMEPVTEKEVGNTKDCKKPSSQKEDLQANKAENFGNITIHQPENNHVRKPKKIEILDSTTEIIDNALKDQDLRENKEDVVFTKELIQSDVTHSYEVTESAETENNLNRYADEDQTKSGYVYEIPTKITNQSITNYTESFWKILGKYNINNNNNKVNYENSKKHPNSNTMPPSFVYIPIPLRYLNRFNSQNHLSPDPLMAVFLSNYGYYLPYLYGHQNGYKNLYGYLASNNIHNNKPFGNYKLFSDTDANSK